MFQGFSDATIDFMWGIRFNNERSWFNEHKQEYIDHFYEPMKALAKELFQRMDDANPDLGLFCKVSRIYRDARRLHGRGPYKDDLWFSFRGPGEQWHDHPTFWFELCPDHWSYGLGFWCAEAATMAKFRARLDRDPKSAEKLIRALNKQNEFVLGGPSYAKAKSAPSELLTEWYNMKNFSFVHDEKNSSVLYDHSLVDRLYEGMEFLVPFYKFLAPISGDPDPRYPD